MKNITFILIILIAISAALKWYLYFFLIRVNFYEILIILFICSFFLYNYKKKSFKLKKELKTYILFIWGWLFLSILSGSTILFYPQSDDSYSFYLKGLFQLFVYTCFFTFLIIYISSISSDKRRKLTSWFLVGVVFSSVYGISQLILIMQYGIDIDENISKFLGITQRNDEYVNFARMAYGYLFRITGITSDPSVHGAYTITAIPLFLLGFIYKKKFVHFALFFIVFTSLILSMSGSGFVGFIFSILSLLIISTLHIRNLKLSYLLPMFLLFIIVIFLYLIFKDHIVQYAKIKFDPNGTVGDHINIAVMSLELGLKYPLGVGLNNISIAYNNQYGISGYNPHNAWIGWFVEIGFVGLFYRIVFSFYIIVKCLKRKSILSQAFFASFIGISIAGLGYQTLNMFYLQLFITLFFSVIMLEESHKKDISAKIVNGIKTFDYFNMNMPYRV